jgi:hypothetical protein
MLTNVSGQHNPSNYFTSSDPHQVTYIPTFDLTYLIKSEGRDVADREEWRSPWSHSGSTLSLAQLQDEPFDQIFVRCRRGFGTPNVQGTQTGSHVLQIAVAQSTFEACLSWDWLKIGITKGLMTKIVIY